MRDRKRPNIVFFLTDDQRFDTIGALGMRKIHTPNIDRLVERGVLFTQAHIPGGTVEAVCMPSRAMLQTGRTLFHIEGTGESISSQHLTIGETLRHNGYRTFGTGKWHNGRESFQRSFTDGDEIVFGGMADHWNVPVYRYSPNGQYDALLPVIKSPWESNRVTMREGDHVHAGKHSSELFCDAAIGFLRSCEAMDPFFMFVSFLAPHDPRSMPESFRRMYDPEQIDLPPAMMGAHPFDNGELHVRDEKLCGFPRTEKDVRRHNAEYNAMISHLDYEVGRVIKVLEERQLLEDTIIVLAGDNGLALGQHGLMGKQSCYEHSVRVPLLFAGPGVPHGVRSDAFVYLLDIFPTLCELAEVDIPNTVEGQSLVCAMNDPAEKVRDTLFFAYRDRMRSVKTARFKLIEYVIDGEHSMTQLFDLQSDPWEERDLAQRPAYAQTVQQLRRELLTQAEKWGDTESRWGRVFWSVFQQSA